MRSEYVLLDLASYILHEGRSDLNSSKMKMAAARSIARLAEPISEDQIIPSPLDRRVVPRVAERIGLE